MARHKDFDGGIDLSEFEPLTFTLMKEPFEAKPAIQGSVLLEFVAEAGGDDGGAAAGALYRFFSEAMEDHQYERFMKKLKDPKIIIDMEKIGEIASWLVEEYSQRPTLPPPSSASGQETSGPTSTEEPS